MQIRSGFFASLLGAALLASSGASATVVTFDDAQGNSVVDQPAGLGGTLTDGGLNFANNGQDLYIYDGSSPNSNGTNNLIFCCSLTDNVTITKTGGGAFDLDSIDMAISWYDSNPSEVITVNGTPLTISDTLTTYDLDLNNVTSVDISGVTSATGYWTADNIVYDASTSVPEPITLSLFGAGLAGAMAMRRRKMADKAKA